MFMIMIVSLLIKKRDKLLFFRFVNCLSLYFAFYKYCKISKICPKIWHFHNDFHEVTLLMALKSHDLIMFNTKITITN